MRFLIDEDVTGQTIKRMSILGFEVASVIDELGKGTKDPAIRRYLRSHLLAGGTVLVTADKEFAGRAGQEGSRLPCLWLRDLYEQEEARVAQLATVIRSEAELSGVRFFMEIRRHAYMVRR